jgi:hypothetical protein
MLVLFALEEDDAKHHWVFLSLALLGPLVIEFALQFEFSRKKGA